jgi:hypothetical protein
MDYERGIKGYWGRWKGRKEEEVHILRKKLREVCDVVDNNDAQDNNNDGSSQQTNGSFALSLSEKCTKAIAEIFANSDKRPGYTWIMACKLSSGDIMETSRFVHAIRQIITDELRDVVGDVLWNEEELKQKRVS